MTIQRTVLPAILLAVALGTTASPVSAQRSERFDWSGTLTAGQRVDVRNVNGPITARPAPGSTLRIEAVKTGRKDDPSGVEIVVVESDRGVTVCPRYPDADGDRDCDSDGNTRNNDVKVAFTLHVPAGVDLNARTVNGEVEARGLDGDLSAKTVNGSIDIAATGTVEASSVNGSIDARGGEATWLGTRAFKTVNGSITVVLPGSVDAEVEGKTVNGSFDSDFPVTIEGRPWGPRSFSGTIGSGGGRLELETVNGAIALRRG